MMTKTYRVHKQFFEYIFKVGFNNAQEVIKGLPEDANIIDVSFNWLYNSIDFLVQSDTFTDENENEVIDIELYQYRVVGDNSFDDRYN